jgi:hypothetical protein
MHKLGTCCADMAAAIHHEATPLIRTESNGVIFLAIGALETPDGVGWLEHAILFCPFCGTRLQTREQVQRGASRE